MRLLADPNRGRTAVAGQIRNGPHGLAASRPSAYRGGKWPGLGARDLAHMAGAGRARDLALPWC